jgi:hypothetical protein
MMTTTPSRRWLRFSLRTLLILIALACCYLAWEIRFVQHRQHLLQEFRSQGIDAAFQFMTAAEHEGRWIDLPPSFKEPPTRISWLRRMLGAEAMQSIHYIVGWEGYSEEKLSELQWAFPEARFEMGSPPDPQH